MLDMSLLDQTRQRLQTKDLQRHQQSDALYSEGRQCVREGLALPPDRARLKRAGACFAKGIQCNHRNPANYWGMGFLFLSLNQPLQALPYIRSGLDCDPDSPLGQSLLQQARSGLVSDSPASAEPAGAQAPGPSPLALCLPGTAEDEPDPDELYEATEADLQSLLSQLTTDPLLTLAPTADPQQLRAVKARYLSSLKSRQRLSQVIQQLDEEIEVAGLQSQMTAVNRQIAALTARIRVREEFVSIQEEIARVMAVVGLTLQGARTLKDRSRLPGLDASLQRFLDQCDRVADRLDELEAQGHDIAPLRPAYQGFIELLESLQDEMEEAVERLQNK